MAGPGWAGHSLRIFANADWVHKYHPPGAGLAWAGLGWAGLDGLGWAGWAGLGRLPLQIGMRSDKTVQLGRG